MLCDIEGHAEPGAADHDLFTEADAQIIQRIRARLRGARPDAAGAHLSTQDGQQAPPRVCCRCKA